MVFKYQYQCTCGWKGTIFESDFPDSVDLYKVGREEAAAKHPETSKEHTLHVFDNIADTDSDTLHKAA